MADQSVDLNLEELKELIRLLKESNVSEFELRKADYRLRIRHGMIVEKTAAPAVVIPVGSQPAVVAASAAAPTGGETFKAAAAAASEAQAAAEAKPAVAEKLHEVRSPMVGTFYRAPNPGANPFVEVGARIRKNQVLCIIEAMKIMNEIESDVEGEVREIHVANGQPVEFGELLFSIKPTL